VRVQSGSLVLELAQAPEPFASAAAHVAAILRASTCWGVIHLTVNQDTAAFGGFQLMCGSFLEPLQVESFAEGLAVELSGEADVTVFGAASFQMLRIISRRAA
jgi:hypothetical protein